MTIDQVITHFGGISEISKALGISYQAVQQWVDKGEIPEGRRWQIQVLTEGKMSACGTVAA